MRFWEDDACSVVRTAVEIPDAVLLVDTVVVELRVEAPEVKVVLVVVLCAGVITADGLITTKSHVLRFGTVKVKSPCETE